MKRFPFKKIVKFLPKNPIFYLKITRKSSAEEIEHKLRSYLHHREFDVNPISINEIKNIIKNKIAIYDLTLDKRTQKIGHGKKLEKYPLDRLPKFLQDNLNNYQEWID